MPIDTFDNGDLLGSVRNVSLNPLIVSHNGLESTVIGHTSEILTLTSDNTTNKSEISLLKSDNILNKNNISSNTSDISDLQDDNTENRVNIGNLISDVSLLESDNTTNKASIASLTSTVSTLVSDNSVNKTDIQILETFTTRLKSELDWFVLDIDLVEDTKYNIISLLKTIQQDSGNWLPMFDTTSNKMVAGVNDNRTLFYKINIYGNFSGASGQSAGTLQVDLEGGVVQRTLLARDNLSSPEVFNIMGFISVDKNGNFSSNGSTISLTPLNRDFTITSVRLIAEQ